ncbi:MAG: hypothetical protein ACREF4_00490 [Gammaproteobacteria bacterium]
MKSTGPKRTRDTVYVIGAGFSAGLGYPLTKSLLIDVWGQLGKGPQSQLRKIIKFHHPGFTVDRKTSFPDIEELLTEIAVNLDLFDASRLVEGRFTRLDLETSRTDLLFTIASWFHDIYKDARDTPWLSAIVNRIRRERAAIVSFNWDLVLDRQLFELSLDAESYGLGTDIGSGPVLLKPHGSLNWYEAREIRWVVKKRRIEIFHHKESKERIEAFQPPRGIKSKVGRHYTPLIVPPTYLKDFNRPVFRHLWRRCTDVLSTPRSLIFLGYSLPATDLHAQYIFRCGFHNQIEGRLKRNGDRYPASGPAQVIIVNPDQDAARRIESVAGPAIPCTWIPKRIEDWLADGS